MGTLDTIDIARVIQYPVDHWIPFELTLSVMVACVLLPLMLMVIFLKQ